MRRRKFLGTVGAAGLASTAGCMGVFEEDLFYAPEDFPYIPEDTVVVHWMYLQEEGEDGDYPRLDVQIPYMKELARNYPENVAIIEYQVSQNETHREIYEEFLDLLEEEDGSSPLTVVNGLAYIGFTEYMGDRIEERIEKSLENPSEANRYTEIMSKFYDVEDPEPREDGGFTGGIIDWFSGLF